MSNPFGSSRYMPGLDGLRTIAIFAVIAYHLNLPQVPGGLLGVGIFFVLSGYLITDILLKQHAAAGRLDLRDFWFRRARRLLPAMMVMLALVSGWLLLTDSSRLSSMKGEIVSALLYYSNWRLIFHDVSYFESFGPPSPLGHLWSLAVEEQFYLIWPLALVFLVRAARTRGKLALWIMAGAAASAMLMALLYVPGSDPTRVYYGTDTRAFGLLIGAALAVVWPSWKLNEAISRSGKMALDAIGIAGLIAVALMIAKIGEYDAFLYRGGMVALSVATAAIVAAMAHPASVLARIIGSKLLRWLGARSYGIYLFHYPVIALSTPAAQVGEFHPLRALLQLLASIALAALSFRYVEEPIRRGAHGRLFAGKPPGGRQRHAGWRRSTVLACICLLAVCSLSCSSPNSFVHGDNGTAQPQAGQSADAGNGEIPTDSPQQAAGQSADDSVSDDSNGSSRPEVDKDQSGDSSGSSQSAIHEPADNGSTSGASGGTAQPPTDRPADSGKDGGDSTDSGKAVNKPGSGDSTGSSKQADGSESVKKPGSGSSTGGGSSKPTPPPAQPIAKDGITVIGDSVILDAKPFLEKLVPGIVVDGKVGRQLSQADDVVADLKKRKQLGKTVVIELGTNGSFTKKQLNGLIEAIGDDHTICFVNTRVPRKWQDVVNDMLADTVKSMPGAKLIDWYAASKNHKDFFGKDGVHLKKSGGESFANLIVESLS